MATIILSEWNNSAFVVIFMILLFFVSLVFCAMLFAIRLNQRTRKYMEEIKTRGWGQLVVAYFIIFVLSIIIVFTLLTVISYLRGGKGILQ